MTERTALKRVLPLLLALLLTVCALCGCGTATDTSGLSGTWYLCGAQDGEIVIPDGVIEKLPVKLRLDPGGGGQASDGLTEGRLKWSYESGRLTVQLGSGSLHGFVENGQIVLQADGTETVMQFVPESAVQEEGDLSETEESSFPVSWYGWWKTEDSSGEMPVSWYDCCAVFEPGEDGMVQMTLWDEEGSRADPLAEISFAGQKDGSLVSQNGYFLFQEIHAGDWQLSPSDQTLYLAEQTHDAAGEQFQYSIFLRPWGTVWDQADEQQRPFYYDDWYVPLLKKKAEMPDEIPWQKLEKARETPQE